MRGPTLLRLIVCSAALMAGGARSAMGAETPPLRLKVLSYNIHHGEGTDERVDLARQAEVIRKADPDLVALQEVDDRTQRTGGIDQTEQLAELTGLKGRFAKQLDYEGGGYGQAVLSRFPLSEVQVHWLPGRPERQRRIAASVTVDLGEQTLTFVTTHLHHFDEQFRREQAEALNSLLAAGDGPIVLAGDLNAVPGSGPIATLEKHWSSATAGEAQALTYPAQRPERQLDYVFVRPSNRIRVTSAKVIEESIASDHRPLLVEFEVR